MTLIIGIKCRDGLVLCADGAATNAMLGQQTIRQSVKKKLHIGGCEKVVVGVSGSMGIGQRIVGNVEEMQLHGIEDQRGRRKDFAEMMPHEVMGFLRQCIWDIVGPELEIARAMAQAVGTPAPIHSALCQALVALVINKEPCLFSFDHQGMPEQVTDDLPFAAIGSGQLIADPFLAFVRRIFWPNGLPRVQEGIFAGIWALQHTIKTTPGGVGLPLQVVTFCKEKEGLSCAQQLPEQQWQEHLQAIESFEQSIAKLPRQFEEGVAHAPPTPTTSQD